MAAESDGSSYEYLSVDDEVLIRQCDVDHFRASGPGGQKRNKTSSAVRLRHLPTGLAATASDDRSQHVNRIRAIRRLRQTIALNVRADLDLEQYECSPLLGECLGSDGRLTVGRRDPRYYQATGEILDVLAACRARVKETAKHLGLSTATLVKLLQRDTKLWKRVNEMRLAAGIKPLR